MRNLYRVANGGDTHLAMASIMRYPDAMAAQPAGLHMLPIRYLNGAAPLPTFSKEALTFPELRRLALAMLMVAQGSALGRVAVLRLDPRASFDLACEPDYTSYLIVLYSNSKALVMAGDEAAPLVAGETWWVNPAGAKIMNNGEDDLVVLAVEVSDR